MLKKASRVKSSDCKEACVAIHCPVIPVEKGNDADGDTEIVWRCVGRRCACA